MQFKTSIYTSISVFLTGALTLVLPSGYSIGSGLLFLASLTLLWSRPTINLKNEDKWLMITVATYSLIFIIQLLWEGSDTRDFDKPIRFLLFLPVFLFILVYPPKLSSLWSGIIIGSILTGSWAIWQKLFIGVERATGYTYVIQFGNISMLFSLFCLAGLGWAIVQINIKRWFFLLILGALFGALASLLSGSRGGWIGLPFILFFIYRAYRDLISPKLKSVIIITLLSLTFIAYATPQTGVKLRVSQAFNDIELYFNGENKNTSLGLRLDMWQAALILIAEKPITGWGFVGYQKILQDLAEQGKVSKFASKTHTHNEYLDNFVHRGILGFFSLLLLYLLPLKLFYKRLNSKNIELRSIAVAGAILPIAFMDFGLSQTFFEHNSGVMVYSFWLAILWGTMRSIEKNTIKSD